MQMVIMDRRPKNEEIFASGDKGQAIQSLRKPLPMAKMERHEEDVAPLFEVNIRAEVETTLING